MEAREMTHDELREHDRQVVYAQNGASGYSLLVGRSYKLLIERSSPAKERLAFAVGCAWAAMGDRDRQSSTV